jgi:hypothetical protein
MAYVNKILQPEEKILAIGKLHWIIYWPAIILMSAAVIALGTFGPLGLFVFVLFGVAAVVAAIKEWLVRWVTEIVVTDRRVNWTHATAHC